MNKIFLVVMAVFVLLAAMLLLTNKFNNKEPETMNNLPNANIEVTPIEHATMVLKWNGKVIYTDPVGGASLFAGKPDPDIILLTDIHGDHLDVEALKAIVKDKTLIIAPRAVMDKMPEELKAKVLVMNNGETVNKIGFKIEAIPMYNLPESAESYHTKGRGNGYVIAKDDTRVYISGDTAGIPEMRNLKDIDMAFIAMNLPYTMSVEEAADVVLQFKPKKIYPYHYRIPEGFSDITKFKEIVNSKNNEIEVVQLLWYPKP